MKLHVGPDVIRYLLPHRRPFCMVDVVTDYEHGPTPMLRASRHISWNEPVFEGHFPGLSLWPGVYTIEGMGQATNLLHVLWTLMERASEFGTDAEGVISALKNMDLGAHMAPGYRPEKSRALESVLRSAEGPSTHIGMAAAVDVKLLAPVFAGQRLDYEVTQTHVLDTAIRFDVAAKVENKFVARGALTSTRGRQVGINLV